MKHGYNGYKKHRCRCVECRRANTMYARKWRRKDRAAKRERSVECPLCDATCSPGAGLAIHLGRMHTKVVTWA